MTCLFCQIAVGLPTERNQRFWWAWQIRTDEVDEHVKSDVKPQPPSLVKKAANFGLAVTKHVYRGMPAASPEERERRKAICLECVGPGGYYNPADDTCLHPKCGCKMSRKRSWQSATCPLNKWDVTVDQTTVASGAATS